LSGGLDSTFIAALIHEHSPAMLSTFSVAFEDPVFDERAYQEMAVAALGTTHHRAECRTCDIGATFPEIIWHAEAPLTRTAPAPMALLSRLVHDLGIKVVMTGEGADEFIGGYNIYKEDKVRRFWAREPESAWRRLPLRRLYPYVGDLGREGDAYLAAFFGQGLTETGSPGYSHRVRWRNTARLQRLFSEDLQSDLAGYDAPQEFLASLDGALEGRSPLAQAQTIEVTTFMSEYLLTSQGDRMMAANSVEGRFPFLDHRVIEFCNVLPPHYKLHGLQEKHVLKRSAEGLIPDAIIRRRKQPYRAPIHRAFFGQPLDYVETLLAPEAVRAAGIWNPQAVDRLKRKCAGDGPVSELDDMALVGIISTQLLHHHFVASFPPAALSVEPLRICRGKDLCA
jgi:asparagine synthase (glutamine-hydrolysing)